jgi:multiple sugar transport system ATP-binding protein
MNFLSARLQTPGETSLVDTLVWGITSLPFDSSNLAAGTPLSLGIRPEHVSLKAADGTTGVMVTAVEYLGSETYVHLETGQDEPLICRCEVSAGWQAGDRVELQLDIDNLHLFDADGTALSRHPHAIETLPAGVPQRSARASAL